jgi:glycosyltransferase involved in cell wall biosynthesis
MNRKAELHLVTPEYPPQRGGVADYTAQLARELARAGDTVHVWAPHAPDRLPAIDGVVVHRDLGRFGIADLERVGRLLDRFPRPRRLLVQWVPHGYGWRSVNLPFCWWLHQRRRRDHVEIIAHEAFLGFFGSWKQRAAAVIHRLMVVLLLRAARRVYVTIPAWEQALRPYCLGRRIPFVWLPVPSNVPVVADPGNVQEIRGQYAGDQQVLVGHFGTYGGHTRRMVAESLPVVLENCPSAVALLLGRGSDSFRDELVNRHPMLATRLHATGGLPGEDVSLHLAACDVLLQPYSGGVSSRCTTIMAGIAHGKPLVTTHGPLTEPIWQERGAVVLVADGDVTALAQETVNLLGNAERRRRLGEAAGQLYRQRFDVRHLVRVLRNPFSPGAEGDRGCCSHPRGRGEQRVLIPSSPGGG